MPTLGIDLGTTKTAVVLYDPETPDASGWARSREHHAALPAAAGFAEQDAGKIYDSVLQLLAEFPREELARVEAVGLTGQMHSVLLGCGTDVSPIVTWQDKRASISGHLEEFRRKSGLPLADGFGAVTLAELAQQRKLDRWDYAATPAGWLAMRLTGNPAAAVTDLLRFALERAGVRLLLGHTVCFLAREGDGYGLGFLYGTWLRRILHKDEPYTYKVTRFFSTKTR